MPHAERNGDRPPHSTADHTPPATTLTLTGEQLRTRIAEVASWQHYSRLVQTLCERVAHQRRSPVTHAREPGTATRGPRVTELDQIYDHVLAHWDRESRQRSRRAELECKLREYATAIDTTLLQLAETDAQISSLASERPDMPTAIATRTTTGENS